MQGKITGIDITGNQIIAVQVKTGLKGPRSFPGPGSRLKMEG